MKARVILCAGYAGTGKDTFSDILVDKLQKSGKSAKKMSLAAPLKEDLRDFIFDKFEIDIENCSRVDKDKVRKLIVGYAESAKDVYGQDIWARELENLIEREDVDYVVVSDCRFPIEVAVFNKATVIGILIPSIGPANDTEEEFTVKVIDKAHYRVYWDKIEDEEEREKYVDKFLEWYNAESDSR